MERIAPTPYPEIEEEPIETTWTPESEEEPEGPDPFDDDEQDDEQTEGGGPRC